MGLPNVHISPYPPVYFIQHWKSTITPHLFVALRLEWPKWHSHHRNTSNDVLQACRWTVYLVLAGIMHWSGDETLDKVVIYMEL